MRIVLMILLSIWTVDFAVSQNVKEVKTSGLWSDHNTWKSGVIPQNGDAIISNITRTSISTTVDYSLNISSLTVLDAKSGGLRINSGDTLHISTNLILANNFTIEIDTLGALIIDGFLIAGDTTKSLTDLIVNNHGYLSVGQNMYAKNLTMNNNNTVLISHNLSVGAVDLLNTYSLTISGLTLGSSSGSTFNLYSDATFGEIILGNNTSVTINAGTKTKVNGSFTGVFNGQNNFTIDGTLIIDGNINAGNYTITGTGNLYVSGDCNIDVDPTLTVKCNDITLPVSLVEFSADQQEDHIYIRWKTASESNNSFFSLSKSYDGRNFNLIDNISGAGNSNSVSAYAYEEIDRHQTIYYQLAQTDFDGKHKIIGVVRIGKSLTQDLSVFPNPVYQGQPIVVSGYSSDMQWRLFDHSGQCISSGDFIQSNNIETNTYPKSTYILKIFDHYQSYTKKIVIR